MGMRPIVLVVCLLSAFAGCAPRSMGEPAPAVRQAAPPPSASARSWFLRARVAEADGDLEEAERALKWLVREDGHRAVTHDHLAAFYARTRRWEEARAVWERSLSRDANRWQPYAGLATLDARAGDRDGERRNLQAAVDRFADADTHERLVRMREGEGDVEGARETYRRWRALEVTDAVLRMRRGHAGRRLGMHELALDDLVAVATEHDRTAETAELIVESARKSCRLRTAWSWARDAVSTEPRVRQAVLDLAMDVGDGSLVERVHGVTPPDRVPDQRNAGARDGVPVSTAKPGLLAAELWRRADRPERARRLAARSEDPWARVVEALSSLALNEGDAARRSLDRIPDGHAAEGWRLGLRVALGDVEPDAAQKWVEAHPDRVAGVAHAAVELYRLPGLPTERFQVRGLRWQGESPPPDEVVRLPAGASSRLEAVVTTRAIERAFAAGRPAEARNLAATWTQRRPTDAGAWIMRARADSEQARAWLDEALELEPCHPGALLLSAHHAPEREQVNWLLRAQEAAPLSLQVQQALSRRGLGAR